jgi:ubiquinone/menaquinone biosynthesis C-methylase UbiE
VGRRAGGAAQVRHPLFARIYARVTEREGAAEAGQRRETLAGLSGRVVELGAGNGRNFGFYPPSVSEVVAVEPEPHMRALAVQAARAAAVDVKVIDGLAGSLPLGDQSFDAAVACLMLCSVPDQGDALRDLWRVLRPNGELRFFEHVQAERQPLRAALAFADRSTIWPRLAGGCHASRDTLSAIEDAGFIVDAVRLFDFSPARPLPAVPHILGIARRPGGSAT